MFSLIWILAKWNVKQHLLHVLLFYFADITQAESGDDWKFNLSRAQAYCTKLKHSKGDTDFAIHHKSFLYFYVSPDIGLYCQYSASHLSLGGRYDYTIDFSDHLWNETRQPTPDSVQNFVYSPKLADSDFFDHNCWPNRTREYVKMRMQSYVTTHCTSKGLFHASKTFEFAFFNSYMSRLFYC